MTAMPWPPSYDFRAPYAGDVPYVRDSNNPYRTSPGVPQNLLRVTRRGADDRPTPEESAIMSSFSGVSPMFGAVSPMFGAVSPIVASRMRGVLAGLGKGGHGGHGGHGHHGGGGRRGRGGGGWYGGGGWGGDTIIYVDSPACPYGTAYDAYSQRCLAIPGMRGTGAIVMSPPDGMHGLGRARSHQSHVASMRLPTGGGNRPGYTAMRRDLRMYRDAAHALPGVGALRAGGYMGAVGREIDAPSADGAMLRGQISRVTLGMSGLGDMANTCTDQGWKTAAGAAAALQALVQAGASAYGASAQSQGTQADARRVSNAAGEVGTGLTQAFTSMCATTSQPTTQTTPVQVNAADFLKQLQDNGLTAPSGTPAPAAPAPAAMSTGTKVAVGGAGLLLVGILAVKFLL